MTNNKHLQGADRMNIQPRKPYWSWRWWMRWLCPLSLLVRYSRRHFVSHVWYQDNDKQLEMRGRFDHEPDLEDCDHSITCGFCRSRFDELNRLRIRNAQILCGFTPLDHSAKAPTELADKECKGVDE